MAAPPQIVYRVVYRVRPVSRVNAFVVGPSPMLTSDTGKPLSITGLLFP